MRAFRVAFLLPVFLLLWLVTTASMCPSNGPTEPGSGRTADIQGFLEISPAVPKPNERVQFEVLGLQTKGNPDAYASWQIAIYSGEWTGPLPTQFQPHASNLVATIEKDGALQPGETPNVRFRYITEGTYTVVLYLTSSTLNGNRYRSAKRRLAVSACESLSIRGFKDTLTLGDGYDAAYRQLEDMGHILQTPGVDPESIPEAVTGEPFSFDLKPFISTAGEWATFALEAQDVETGLTVSSDGILSGTVLEGTGGLHWMRIRIADSCLSFGPFGVGLGIGGFPRDIVVRWPVRIVDTTCPGFEILPALLPSAALNEPYSQTFTTSGGTPPVTLELLAGTLPAGISFTGTGLSGTPTEEGEFNFTIRGVDSCIEDDARIETKDYTLTVIDPADCPELPGGLFVIPHGQVGQAYDQNLLPLGGLSPVTGTLIEGTLPPGLSLNPSTFHLAGTPTSDGEFWFQIRWTDSCPEVQNATRQYQLIIDAGSACATLSGNTSTMPNGIVGVAYTNTISFLGGQPPFEMDISAGSLPSGLSLFFTGVFFQVTGTPTSEGTFNFTARVTDACVPPQEVSMPLSITIDPVPECLTPPNIDITGLPSGTVGIDYEVDLSHTGGTGDVSYSLVPEDGSLPPGLLMVPSTGTIAGTPTIAGTFNFTVRVADSCVPPQADEAPATIVIDPAGGGCNPLNLSPLTVEDATVGVFYEHFFGEWVNGGEAPYQFFIQAPTLPPPGMSIDQDTGTLSGTPTVPGEYQFIFQVIDSCVPFQSASELITLTVN